MPRRPRQPQRAHRIRGYKGNRHPMPSGPQVKRYNAARKIQAAVRRNQAVKAYNAEIFQCRLAPQNIHAVANTASAQNGPKNTTVILPAMWNQHSTWVDSEGGAMTPAGSWVCPKYLKTKLRISFDKIIASDLKSNEGFNISVTVGRLCSTGEKFGANAANAAGFETSVLTELRKQLFESNLSSDHLAFEKKNRQIKIDGSWKVKPSRDQAVRMCFHNGTGNVSYSCPPPKEYTVQHKLYTAKTKVDKTTPAHPLPMNLWIPFILVQCDELHGAWQDEHSANHPGTGYLDVDYSSRAYFTDV